MDPLQTGGGDIFDQLAGAQPKPQAQPSTTPPAQPAQPKTTPAPAGDIFDQLAAGKTSPTTAQTNQPSSILSRATSGVLDSLSSNIGKPVKDLALPAQDHKELAAYALGSTPG